MKDERGLLIYDGQTDGQSVSQTHYDRCHKNLRLPAELGRHVRGYQVFCVFGLSEKFFFGHFRGCEGELFVYFFFSKSPKT